MSTVLVYVVYGFSVLLAFFFLYLFHTRWYWHVLSVLAALAIGFAPPIPGWVGESRDVAYGFAVLFLLVWGLGEPFIHRFHRQAPARHA